MKRWLGKIVPVFLLTAVAVSAVLIGAVYYNFMSQKIYEDSTGYLSEIYGQVNRSFATFVEKNWGVLDGWNGYISSCSDSEAEKFLKNRQEYWGFSEFYFLAADKSYITPDGKTGQMQLDDTWDDLVTGGEPVMISEKLADGQDTVVFAVPSEHGEYKGTEFDAIAVSYTNAALAESLNVDAFSGNAKCFIIRNDGDVLLSTQAGGSVFGNYLVYLRAASDLGEENISAMEADWKNGESGLLRCEIGGVSHCLLYQPVGYRDFYLLSSVPQSAVSAGFLSVQNTTMLVLAIIFTLVGATVIAVVIVRSRRQSRINKTELQYRERMFDVLSNSVDDIFIMLDSEKQTVDYISPNIERLLGITLQEARGNIRVLEKCAVNYNVIFPRSELEAIPLNGNRYWECEYMHQSTGERRWYRMTIYRMEIGGVRKYIVVMSDRTLDQQMNQKLREALDAAKSANEAKSNFLSNMSHDIRTPMNAIVGFSVLLEKDAEDPERVKEYTRKIMASSHHLLSLINDVLDMSKIESGKTSLNIDRFSLPELLEELNIILMPQARAKAQSFTIHVNGAPPELILGDKLRLNQILINLLSNAVKYTPEGGEIEFTVSTLPSPSPQYARLRFAVRDNGIGMSEEFQQQVFLPFSREINSVTNKIQGTGLGMAITKNLVDLMGGIINVQSAPGKGSTFTVELTFSLPDKEEEEQWYRRKVTRILAADDEEDVCLNIREALNGSGVDVTTVTDGASAVELALAAHGKGRDYDIILLDWKMPEMDGVETARRIRDGVGKDIPILVLTSYDWTEIETEARRAGINAFMPKPFFASTFWHTVKPFFISHSEGAVKEADEGESPLSGKLFLVAEDNELNAEILTEMLGIEGAECNLTSNGLEAAEKFISTEPGHYDMILMDVQMPVMNGYDATRKIRASSHPEAKTIPIVAMTANTFAEDVRDAFDAGMNGHLAKPIDMNAVRELVGRILDERGKG